MTFDRGVTFCNFINIRNFVEKTCVSIVLCQPIEAIVANTRAISSHAFPNLGGGGRVMKMQILHTNP